MKYYLMISSAFVFRPNASNLSLSEREFKKKKEWFSVARSKYKSVAKIAYVSGKPQGLIQYLPRPTEEIIEIICVYVPNRDFQQQGIATKLFQALKENVHRFVPLFNNSLPKGFVAKAFDVPGYFSLRELYPRLGFKASEENPDLFYYPLEKGWKYLTTKKRYRSLEKDQGKALLFYDPSCPFCIYFNDQITIALREIAPHLKIQKINTFFQEEEVIKRGGGEVAFCVVNGVPIQSFFLDKESFEKEVKEASQAQYS